MTLPIFPSNILGLSWGRPKSPIWSTGIHQTASGKENSTSYWSYPRWKFALDYEFLRDDSTDEFHTMAGFFNNMKGARGYFLYNDPYDHSVTAQGIGIGNGALTKFQLVRSMGGFVEPMQNINGAPLVYFNGTLQTSGWTVDGNGVVTFASAPTSGVVIAATFSYYFRCRFLSDTVDFVNFLVLLWELKKLEFISMK